MIALGNGDSRAAAEIEARLEQNGYDAIDINAEVFLQSREQFAMFDHMLHAAQHRRMVLLREINVRREFGKRADIISEAMIEANLARVAKIRFGNRR